jgi:hypothetical protein
MSAQSLSIRVSKVVNSGLKCVQRFVKAGHELAQKFLLTTLEIFSDLEALSFLVTPWTFVRSSSQHKFLGTP